MSKGRSGSQNAHGGGKGGGGRGGGGPKRKIWRNGTENRKGNGRERRIEIAKEKKLGKRTRRQKEEEKENRRKV